MLPEPFCAHPVSFIVWLGPYLLLVLLAAVSAFVVALSQPKNSECVIRLVGQKLSGRLSAMRAHTHSRPLKRILFECEIFLFKLKRLRLKLMYVRLYVLVVRLYLLDKGRCL